MRMYARISDSQVILSVELVDSSDFVTLIKTLWKIVKGKRLCLLNPFTCCHKDSQSCCVGSCPLRLRLLEYLNTARRIQHTPNPLCSQKEKRQDHLQLVQVATGRKNIRKRASTVNS
jgi:hypothetical protein